MKTVINSKNSGCPCGVPAILADTEDWKIPICNFCYERIGSPDRDPSVEWVKEELIYQGYKEAVREIVGEILNYVDRDARSEILKELTES